MSAKLLVANVVALVHFAYVAFVIFGQVAIVAGLALGRGWARGFAFRTIHLGMIAVVVLESWAGLPCPLTILEQRLRQSAGQQAHELGFLAHWVHRVMFFQLPSWIFTATYTAFGACVLLTFSLAPPRWPRRHAAARP